MKKKRFIKLKDPRLIRTRTELRTLLSLVWDKQISELYDQIKAIEQDSSLNLKTQIHRQNEIRKRIKELTEAYIKALISCRTCGHRDSDLTYVPAFDTWYCEPCYKYSQDYYKRHPDEADWRILFP